MDSLSMLMNATVRDINGDRVGEVIGVHLALGKLSLTIDIELDTEDEDPDGGAEEDIPEDDALETEFPKIVAMGNRVGTNG